MDTAMLPALPLGFAKVSQGEDCNGNARLRLVFQRDLAEADTGWLAFRERVSHRIETRGGERFLILTPGSTFGMSRLGGNLPRGAVPPAVLLMPMTWLAGFPIGRQAITAVSCALEQNGLALRLPDWAQPPARPAVLPRPAPVKAVAPRPAPPVLSPRPVPQRAPYVGICERVADPVANLRTMGRLLPAFPREPWG